MNARSSYTTAQIICLVSAIIACILLASLLRLYNIPGMALGFDDIISITIATRDFFLQPISVFIYDRHPPLYYSVLGIWMKFGTSNEFILISSILFNVITIVFIFLIGNRLSSWKVGLSACFIFAIHPFAIYWSHFARAYSLIILTCVVIFFLNEIYCTDKDKRKFLFIPILLVEVFLCFIHAGGIYFLSIVVLFFFVSQTVRAQLAFSWINLQACALIIGAPALIVPILARLGSFAAANGDTGNAIKTIAVLVSGPNEIHETWILLCAVSFGLLTALLLLKKEWRVFGAVGLALPVFGSYAMNATGFTGSWGGSRAIAFVLPFFCLATSILLVGTETTRLRKVASVLVGSLVIVLSIRGTYNYVSNFDREAPYRNVLAILNQETKPGDLIVTPHNNIGWGLKWYLIGPEWQSALAQRVISQVKASAQQKTSKSRKAKALIAAVDTVVEFDTEKRGNPIGILVANRIPEPENQTQHIWWIELARHDGDRVSRAKGSLHLNVQEYDVGRFTLKRFSSASGAGEAIR